MRINADFYADESGYSQMRKDILISAVPIIILILLIFFRPFYGWWLRGLFAPGVVGGVEVNLRLENEKLKSEIAELHLVKSQIPAKTYGYLTAMVYSRYPFNFKNELLVNIGARDGVTLGKPVLFGDALLGRVSQVFDESSLIETVFDGGFELPVGIGNSGEKALFNGGSLPGLSLISLSGSVKEGDVVYSISPDFPYGIPIGEIQAIHISSDHLFREAPLKFPYDLNEVKAVLVRK